MNTDIAWEEWGKRDPYYGVITDPKFRRAEITQAAKQEFFDSGRHHAQYVMQMIHLYIDPHFEPKCVLDFGCGVGRLVVPFAEMADRVVGLDVSSAMLAEARLNCRQMGLANTHLLLSDDTLSALTEKFDLIHSYIVFQHIPPERGRALFAELLKRLADGGIGTVHFAYSKAHYADTHGLAPAPASSLSNTLLPPDMFAAPLAADRDPEMQMNPYNLNELLFLIQGAGVRRFHVEFTDHGGELGVFVFFQKP